MSFHLSPEQNPCLHCPQSDDCLGRELSSHLQEEGQCLVLTRMKPGQHLFRSGDEAGQMFVSRAGAFKAYTTTADGQEQVLAFYSPGDLIGLETLGEGSHSRNAVSLSFSEVCRLPVAAMRRACTKGGAVQTHLLEAMSGEVSRLQGLLQLERLTADQRVAFFLLNQRRRQARSRASALPAMIRLPMSRSDIGRFLGLATETVSRALTRLEQSGAIRTFRSRIEFSDPATLEQMLLPCAPAEQSKAA